MTFRSVAQPGVHIAIESGKKRRLSRSEATLLRAWIKALRAGCNVPGGVLTISAGAAPGRVPPLTAHVSIARAENL